MPRNRKFCSLFAGACSVRVLKKKRKPHSGSKRSVFARVFTCFPEKYEIDWFVFEKKMLIWKVILLAIFCVDKQLVLYTKCGKR